MTWADIFMALLLGYTVGYSICNWIDASHIKKLKREVEDQRKIIASLMSEKLYGGS